MHVEILETSHDRPLATQRDLVQAHPSGLASLSLPFKAGQNHEDLDHVVRRNHMFLQRYGLLQSDALPRRGLSEIVRYAALLYPIAEDAALDIAVDAVTWSSLWSEQYQRLCHNDDQLVDSMIWQLVDITLHRVGIQPADEAPPLVWAFADIWKREAARLSLLYQQRAATNWRRWFLCFARDDIPDQYRDEPSLSNHPSDRYSTYSAVLGDLIEGSLKFELPRGTYESPEVEELRDILADSMRWVSDIASASEGNPRDGNVVSVLQKQWRLSTDQAIGKVCDMHGRLMQRWCLLRDRLPHLYGTLRLDEEARIQLQRYVMGVESLMAGHYAWHAGVAPLA